MRCCSSYLHYCPCHRRLVDNLRPLALYSAYLNIDYLIVLVKDLEYVPVGPVPPLQSASSKFSLV